MVGESPSASGDRFWRYPLSGAPAKTLCRCAGWAPDGPASELGSWTWALYARFVTRNIFVRHADAVPWSRGAAADRARAIYDEAALMAHPAPPTIVLLGRRVAAAFALGEYEFGRPVVVPPLLPGAVVSRIVVLPHPSGRNLLMNDPATREMVGAALRMAVDET